MYVLHGSGISAPAVLASCCFNEGARHCSVACLLILCEVSVSGSYNWWLLMVASSDAISAGVIGPVRLLTANGVAGFTSCRCRNWTSACELMRKCKPKPVCMSAKFPWNTFRDETCWLRMSYVFSRSLVVSGSHLHWVVLWVKAFGLQLMCAMGGRWASLAGDWK